MKQTCVMTFIIAILLNAWSVQAEQEGMVLIPEGVFMAGSSAERAQKLCLKNNKVCKLKLFLDEEPRHLVFLPAFYIDRYEVNQNEFQKVMRENPSEFKAEKNPVDSVTWYEAREYCELVGKRLPTEAEWEKAAKGGKDTLYPWGDEFESGKANMCDAHCDERWKESQFKDGYKTTAPIGSFPPNDYGLFDMAGNVYEWVMDWYDEDYYVSISEKSPRGPLKGKQKVFRGGSWINYSVGVRPSDRTGAKTGKRFNFVGFRCAK
jgi:formylglycine-generating enzyme required for sulfatase activity